LQDSARQTYTRQAEWFEIGRWQRSMLMQWKQQTYHRSEGIFEHLEWRAGKVVE
jgi:hypothetical protein